jgi:Cu2+-exporting ATPase
MTCCAPGVEGGADTFALPSAAETALASRALGNGLRQVELSVPAVHCAACIVSVENALKTLDGVEAARVNLSSKRITVRYRDGLEPALAETLAQIGYPAHLAQVDEAETDSELKTLIRAVGVAGFAAGNIMLLSVSVWSGAEGATRDLFHFVSALIALPALVFAGGVYYRSAWAALRHGRMNMDVPIAIGVTMAYAMSLYETIAHGPHAYFDASVSLLFFLLIGRTLDHVMRDRARAAVLGLARLSPRGALVLTEEGREYRPVSELEPGMRILLGAGERVPVDARVISGTSDIDAALVTGESRPDTARVDSELQAGALNLTGPLEIEALRPASQSFLAEMLQMLEAAEGGRARYRRIAERVSALYAPVVHLGALATFLGWMVVGGEWHHATVVAIAVLIITCPCALGLAVPIVQVMAARRLFEAGILVKDGSAMERLAEADHVVFDKTGTLTVGEPRLANLGEIAPARLDAAASRAVGSRHPLSRAIAAAGRPDAARFHAVTEVAGYGIEGRDTAGLWRLGRAGWAAGDASSAGGTVLSRNGVALSFFRFEDRLRADARATVAELASSVGPVEMLSGDAAENCVPVAASAGIANFSASVLPAGKVVRIEALAGEGHRVLMVGDGLNDAPALAAAHVSMAPASAADVGRNAADFVFLNESLSAVPVAVSVARQAGRLIRQNIAFAILYNVVAVPIAVLGHATPLIAAIAMSASSLVVIANALRLGRPATLADPILRPLEGA